MSNTENAWIFGLDTLFCAWHKAKLNTLKPKTFSPANGQRKTVLFFFFFFHIKINTAITAGVLGYF